MSRDSDLCVITEMWLKGDDEMAHKSIPPDGYKVISHPRTDGWNGGGIAVIYREFLRVNEEREMQNNQMMESNRFKIELSLCSQSVYNTQKPSIECHCILWGTCHYTPEEHLSGQRSPTANGRLQYTHWQSIPCWYKYFQWLLGQHQPSESH